MSRSSNRKPEPTAAPSDHASPAERVLVLLCTYNEVQNLPRIVELLHEVLPAADILVVDDNSPDGTGRWVESRKEQDPWLHLLSRAGKLGLGSALLEGIQWCLARDYRFLINLDADLSHPPGTAPTLLAACQSTPCDVAIGSRYIAGGGFQGLAWHRRLLSRVLNSYATRMLRLPLTDCSGSFRCYRASALRKLNLSQLTCTGYGFLEELLVHLHRSGATFTEVPILFESRWSGESKLGLSDAMGALRVIHRLAFRSPPKP